MSNDKNQKGIENEKQGEEGGESEMKKCSDLKVINTIYTKIYIKRTGRSKTCCGRS